MKKLRKANIPYYSIRGFVLKNFSKEHLYKFIQLKNYIYSY